MKKQNYYYAELCAASINGDTFGFNVYKTGTKRILGVVTVQHGKVVEGNGLEPYEDNDWASEEVRTKANDIAKEKGLFDLVEKYFFLYVMQCLGSFESLNQLVPNRSELSRTEEETYVQKCYELYREEGFADVYRSPYCWKQEYYESPFKVLREIPVQAKDFDLEQLPQWEIQFPDGVTTVASPEEIILSEQLC